MVDAGWTVEEGADSVATQIGDDFQVALSCVTVDEQSDFLERFSRSASSDTWLRSKKLHQHILYREWGGDAFTLKKTFLGAVDEPPSLLGPLFSHDPRFGSVTVITLVEHCHVDGDEVAVF